MCFQSLIDDEEASKPLGTLIRQELPYAVREGLVAAAIVLAVLLVGQTPAWIIGVSMVGAVVLGVVLHQFVLVAGLGVRRLLFGDESEPESAAEVA
jgi:hypothetical protein